MTSGHPVYGNPDGHAVFCRGLTVLFGLLKEHQFYTSNRYTNYKNAIKPYLLTNLGNSASVRAHWKAVDIRCDVMCAIARLDYCEHSVFHENLNRLGISNKCSSTDLFLIDAFSDAQIIPKRSRDFVSLKLREWKPYWDNTHTTQKELQNIIHFINFLRDADYQIVKDKLFDLDMGSMDVFDVMNICNFIAQLPLTPTRNDHLRLALNMLRLLDEHSVKVSARILFHIPFDMLKNIDDTLRPLDAYTQHKAYVANFIFPKIEAYAFEYNSKLRKLLEHEVTDIAGQSLRVLAIHGNSDVKGEVNARLVKAVCRILSPQYTSIIQEWTKNRRKNVIDAALPYITSTMTLSHKTDMIGLFSAIPDAQLSIMRQKIDRHMQENELDDRSLVRYIYDLNLSI